MPTEQAEDVGCPLASVKRACHQGKSTHPFFADSTPSNIDLVCAPTSAPAVVPHLRKGKVCEGSGSVAAQTDAGGCRSAAGLPAPHGDGGGRRGRGDRGVRPVAANQQAGGSDATTAAVASWLHRASGAAEVSPAVRHMHVLEVHECLRGGAPGVPICACSLRPAKWTGT